MERPLLNCRGFFYICDMDDKKPEKENGSEVRFMQFFEENYKVVEQLNEVVTTDDIYNLLLEHELPYKKHEINSMLLGMEVKNESINNSIDKVWFITKL